MLHLLILGLEVLTIFLVFWGGYKIYRLQLIAKNAPQSLKLDTEPLNNSNIKTVSTKKSSSDQSPNTVLDNYIEDFF